MSRPWTAHRPEIDVTGMSTATHTVTGLTIGKSYTFKIKAVAGSVDSRYSAATSAVGLKPPAVTGLMATAGIGQVALSWTASTTTGVTGYTIRQTVDGTETEIDVSGMSAASHTVTGLAAGEEPQLHHCSSYCQRGKHTEHCSNGNADPACSNRLDGNCGLGSGGTELDGINSCRRNRVQDTADSGRHHNRD